MLGIFLLGREHYDCRFSATCGQVLATSGMVPLNAYRELRQCYLVNENNPVGGFWLSPCRGLQCVTPHCCADGTYRIILEQREKIAAFVGRPLITWLN